MASLTATEPATTVLAEDAVDATRIRTRRWTRREYDRLIEIDLLHEDDPVELVEGRLLVAEPQDDPHARAVELAAEALRHAFGPGWRIRVQLPLALGAASEPEPDVAVVKGSLRDAPAGHPTTAALVVEVAASSLRLDRGLKARSYARAGIADYWIVNLLDRVLEVHREPARPGPARRHWGYAGIRSLGADAAVTPIATPAAGIRVAELLP
jgi:Uma2 family endonuclease